MINLNDYLYEWKLLFINGGTYLKHSSVEMINNIIKTPFILYQYIEDSINFYKKNPWVLKNEILCGISVAIMQVPESIAFSFVARISPVRGLYSTFFIGLFGGLFTSLPGLVSGIAGSMVAIVTEITSDSGPLGYMCLSDRIEYAIAVMMVCGIIQFLIGVFNLTKFIKLIPHSVMVGFMNGLSIIVFEAQLYAFQTNDENGTSQIITSNGCPPLDYTPPTQQRWLRLNEVETWLVLIIVFISMAFMILQPKIKRRIKIWKFSISANIIPPALSSMIVTTLIGNVLYNNVFHKHIRLIGDEVEFSGSVPTFKIPDIDWTSTVFWLLAIQYGILLAMVGLMESVLTWRLCQRNIKINLSPELAKWEAYSQGIGNIVSTFFSSIGGSVMVGESVLNFTNGARGRLSTIVASFTILLIVSVAGKIIELMPIGTLTGILFVIVMRSFEWKTFQYILKLSIPITDIISIILVTILAVTTNLAIAVLIGICWCSVVYAWKSSNYTKLLKKDDLIDDNINSDIVTINTINDTTISFHLFGPLFFGSSTDLEQYFIKEEQILDVHEIFIIDFERATVYDSSGIEFLRHLSNEILIKRNKKLMLINLDENSRKIVTRSKKVRNISQQLDGAYELYAEDIQREQSGIIGYVENTPTISSLYQEDIEKV